MAIMRIRDIVSMSSEDRAAKLVDLRAELARIRTMINAGGAVENPTRVRELRKAIAQILTVENEEKLGIRKVIVETKEKPKKKPAKTAEKTPASKKTEAETVEAEEPEETAPQ